MKKVVLVTGATSGIGKAAVERLVKDGHTVYGSHRKPEESNILEEVGVNPIQMEMTDYSTLESAVNKILEEQNRIDVLFNNAGYGLYGTVEDTSMEDAHHQFEVNLFGLARLTQLVLPHMRKQKSGTIINTSSMGGKIYTPLGAWYHATKHALEGWSDCLRLEVAQFGINVVIIEPGMIETNFAKVVFEPAAKRFEKSAYKNIFDGMMKGMDNSTLEGSPPSVIADVVSKAISSNKPKTRYVAGKMAKMLLFVRKVGGDKVYDKFIMNAFTKS